MTGKRISTGAFLINRKESDLFASLSGDFNPLHVDPTYARRLQFGQTVMHGIHHLLRALDCTLTDFGIRSPIRLKALSASFQSPASVGHEITYSSELSEHDGALRVSSSCGRKPILTLFVQFEHLTQDVVESVPDEFPRGDQTALEQTFPPTETEGELPLSLRRDAAADLLPELSKLVSARTLAQIIATTRVIGMKIPGLHSIYARLHLDFSEDTSQGDRLRYRIARQDARVQLTKLEVDSAGLKGHLDAFFRPKPISQPTWETVLKASRERDYRMQRALVVGGSRGVGETTAKILAAAGAKVIITYNRGAGDAERVAREIREGGGCCTTFKLDVCEPELPTNTPPFSDSGGPSHIYYFASPHIEANRSPHWNSDIFHRLSAVYIDAFSSLVNRYCSSNEGVSFFYPSSIYVAHPERGFSEYAVAKSAGEALCRQLAARFPAACFYAPRLPRMASDQTASIVAIKTECALDVMLSELDRFTAQTGS